MESLVLNKRKSILEATLKLATHKGFVGTSTALIAKEANVGMGTIYRYFENKEQLLSELFEDLRNKLNVVIINSYDYNRSDPYENFENIIRGILDYYSENPLEFQFLGKYSDSPYMDKQRLDDSCFSLEPMMSLFAGIELKPLPVHVIFALVYGPLISIMHLVQIDKVELNNEIIKEISKACWNAITK